MLLLCGAVTVAVTMQGTTNPEKNQGAQSWKGAPLNLLGYCRRVI